MSARNAEIVAAASTGDSLADLARRYGVSRQRIHQIVRSRRRSSQTYEKHCAAEVDWYRQRGRYPDRIARSRSGVAYVIGDWAWNRQHSDRPEMVEQLLPEATPAAPQGAEGEG